MTDASLTAAQIRRLIPHAGTMCLLDQVSAWSHASIECAARSHANPDNPLRHAGRISALCGIEYGLQAMAVHGALRGGAPQPIGYLVRLGTVRSSVEFLDELGAELIVRADSGPSLPGGYSYEFAIAGVDRKPAITGRATIALVG